MNIFNFSILAKDANNIAFGEIEWERTDIDPGARSILCVPRGGGVSEAAGEFDCVDSLDFRYYIHCIVQDLLVVTTGTITCTVV